jgi:hypothetical protein
MCISSTKRFSHRRHKAGAFGQSISPTACYRRTAPGESRSRSVLHVTAFGRLSNRLTKIVTEARELATS